MMHPDTRLGFVNDTVGFGVFATQFIPKGTVIWALDDLDQRLNEAYVTALDAVRRPDILKYAYRDREGQYVLCWDLGRYMNHSSNPNTMSTAYDFDIAIRDIYPGEQITCDYGCLNLDEPFQCLPEPGSDRTEILPDDIPRFAAQWDEIVADAMQSFNQVEQPLQHLIQSKYRDRVFAVAQGKASLDSVLCQYYQGDRAVQVATV